MYMCPHINRYIMCKKEYVRERNMSESYASRHGEEFYSS